MRFTHKGKLYGFNIYFNSETNEVQGENWFSDKMISLCIWLAMNVFDHEGFLITDLEEMDEE